MKYYLAIDIGASSGRHTIGWRENGELRTGEVYRFANGMIKRDGRLTWDVESIFAHVKAGIRAAFAEYPSIESLSIDTWGVDYVLLRGSEPVLPVFAYRDNRTETAVSRVHERIPFEELYKRTGIQYQPFNTIYQLYEDKLSGRLDGADDFLMLPEYLIWRLCGVRAREYTNATTTGLVNAIDRQYDREVTGLLGLPRSFFGQLAAPGTNLGNLLPETADEAGGQTRVVLCATHDTASAVEGIPMKENAPFLSTGTWSLLGVKLPSPLTDEKSRISNFTNEGGVGYIRYLKNIMGMWIIQCLQKQVSLSFDEMDTLAKTSGFTDIFDVNDRRFNAPSDMRKEISRALGGRAAADADIINSVYHSLAFSYQKAINELEENTGREWDELYAAGGGAKNKYMEELIIKYTGKRVISLPIEATACGNLKIQMEADNGV
ncbi:MAG: rhamnulokinase [Treponema sp.]|jgi:rhamnulokinase|nr:rhamnulokinase [Treponema sp.]